MISPRSFAAVRPWAVGSALSALSLGLAAPSANAALSVRFSFTSASPYLAGTIEGTVDGLPDGDGNVFCSAIGSCSGITATVISVVTPDGEDPAALGTYTFLSAGSSSSTPGLAFTVTNGVLSFANANFGEQGGSGVKGLTLGGFVSGPDFPNFNYTELKKPGTGDVTQYRISGPATFAAVTTPAPGPLPLLGTAVALGWSRRLRGRIRA